MKENESVKSTISFAEMTSLLRQFIDWLLNKPPDPRSPQGLNVMVMQARSQTHKGLLAKMRSSHPNQAKMLADLLTNYIFDFGNYGIDLEAQKITRQTIDTELAKVSGYKIVPPDRLCIALVHRAVQMKEFKKFDEHMRDLWMLCLIPIGQFTPGDSMFPTRAHQNLANRLRTIEITARQIEAYRKAWGEPTFKT